MTIFETMVFFDFKPRKSLKRSTVKNQPLSDLFPNVTFSGMENSRFSLNDACFMMGMMSQATERKDQNRIAKIKGFDNEKQIMH